MYRSVLFMGGSAGAESRRLDMRILITGASGSGTSTLGRFLASQLAWTYLDADDYYWLRTTPPFRQKRDPAARLSLLLDDLGKAESAIIGGSILGYGLELEDDIPHERVAESITLVHPPYDYETLER